MADEQQFIDNGLQRTRIDEFFADELGRAGYGGMEIAKTPMGTQIVLKAEKPGMVIGKGGKNIRKITDTLETEFGLDDPQVDVQEVDEPDLNARIVADRLANALERGWYFRKAGHTTIDRIMEAGAHGAEIVLSGKVTGARSRVEKFNRGYIKHNGEPAEEIVDYGVSTAVVQLGTIGVQVKIIPPGAELPDDFEIREGVEVEDYVAEAEGVDELLAGEPENGVPEDGEDAEPAIGAPPEEDARASAPDEEVIEEAPDEEVVEEAPDEEIVEEDAEFDDPDLPDEDAVEEELDDLEADVEEELDEETEAEAEDLLDEMADADDESADTDEEPLEAMQGDDDEADDEEADADDEAEAEDE
ncbi:30S ribosomal protein S3 [Halobacteriales archaeon SW_7_65_23]|nr:MAG: 30S ribosomal protein S3 [Halobacteriales archaeon SW_7_65_23]